MTEGTTPRSVTVPVRVSEVVRPMSRNAAMAWTSIGPQMASRKSGKTCAVARWSEASNAPSRAMPRRDSS